MGQAQSSSNPKLAAHGTAEEPTQRLLETLRAMEVRTKREVECASKQRVGISDPKHVAAAAETGNAEAEISEKDYVLVDGTSARRDMGRERRITEKGVDVEAVGEWEKEVLGDRKNRLAMAAFTKNPTTSIISSTSARIADTQTFNIRIPIEGSPVTNQRSSGRCWLFASTNVFRIALMKKHNLQSFELSQAYLFFYDQLEKSNYFLETILDTVDQPLDGRLLTQVMSAPTGDGGQWDMAANLVKKYGLVPHDLYPDSEQAMNSSSLGSLLRTKLREDALHLRRLANNSTSSTTSTDLTSAKTAMLKEIHLILTLMLGPPPSPNKPFTWSHYTPAGTYTTIHTTPLAFAAELSHPSTIKACAGTDVNALFSLVNDPRNPFDTLLTVDRLGNVYDGHRVRYVNSAISVLKAAAVKQLKAGISVFFGCDVGKFSDSRLGVMDTRLYDYELGFNVRLGMSKGERLMTRESAMTHAMVLTAVHLEPADADSDSSTGTQSKSKEEKPVRWRVENSWSDAVGDKGYFVMSDEWFTEFVYQVVVDPGFVSKETRDVLKQSPRVLPLWDPMGALA